MRTRNILYELIRMLLLLILVSFLAFVLIAKSPIDPLVSYIGTNSTLSPEAKQEIVEHWGLNEPVFTRFFKWLVNILHGDMGTSYNYNVPVAGMVLNKVPITLTMAIMSFVLTILVSIPLGIFTAKYENGFIKRKFKIRRFFTKL